MHPYSRRGAAARALRAVGCGLILSAFGCSRERGAAGCSADQLDVTWPATIERGGVATRERLSATLTPTQVPPEVFDTLRSALTRGRPTTAAVAWSVPAFNTSPGGIAVAHKAALARGEVLQVTGALDGGGWGVLPAVPRGDAQAGLEAGEFVARDASGTIAVLATEPLALRLDLVTRDSAGDTIRVRGDATFAYRRARGASCER